MTTATAPSPTSKTPSRHRSPNGVLLTGTSLRRLGSFLLLGLTAAVVTGSDGSSDEPLSGVKDSLFDARVIPYLLIAVAAWLAVFAGPQLRQAASSVADRAKVPAAPIRAGLEKRNGILLLNLALVGIAVAAPLFVSTAAQQSMVSDIGIYALLALGLNVVVGYAGLLDLGYIAFYAIGAYTTAYIASDSAMPWHAPFQLNPFFIFPIAALVAAVAGVVLGAPTLRLRGDYLAIVTLGFGEIIHLIANNADDVTNGARGIRDNDIPPLSIDLAGFDYEWGLDPLPYYYLLLAIIIVVMIAFGRLERSRIGRAWAAIREDEVAAEATGVPTLRLKLMAFAIGASVSGFAGVLFASKQFFNPQSFTLQLSFFVVVVVIFGGMGSRLGVVVGAVVLQGLAFYLRDKVPPADRYIYFGAIVVIMMIFRPQGLIPSRRRKREIQLHEAGIGGADSLGAAPTTGKVAP